MTMKGLFVLSALGITVLLIAGCTMPESSLPSTGPGEAPATVSALQPQPTSVVPAQYEVSIQVQKNVISTDPWISVVFEGGAGLGYATLMEARVVRSDGVIEEKTAYKPVKGTRLLFNGTTKTDRVIVTVSYVDGSRYTVTDVQVPFRDINPT